MQQLNLTEYYALLNLVLYRNLRDDYPSDIFPKAFCLSKELGNGDTLFSVEQMATTINTYYKQCGKIAPLLQGSSLAKTAANIHRFSFTHFQYQADGALQKLRSPACSWAVRKYGIDCKSYSILAGSILKMLGIGFYIRRIKQYGSLDPNEFSHVYIVVPIDQKKYNLEKGYYVIDGTIPTMDEGLFKEKSDYLMAMKHISLNGRHNFSAGLNATITPTGGYNISDPNAPSSPVGGGTSGGGFWKGFGKVTEGVGKLINLYGSFEAAKRGINQQAGSNFIPSNIQTQEQFNAWLQAQQTNGNDRTMEVLAAILPTLIANKDNDKKPDYTPWIIGGVAFFVLVIGGVVLFTMDKKK